MSTKYLTSLALMGSLIFSGCQKLTENPKATITALTYYNTAADLQAALSGVYEQYAYDGTWGFTNRMTTYFGADDLTTDPGLNKGPLREFDMLSGTSQNIGMDIYNTWKGIYQANNLLAVYQKADAPDSIKNIVAGQCYFLRAIGFYYLVRTYGPLPLVTKPVNPNSHPKRDSVAKIYDTIVADLQKAKSLLPNQWPPTEIGRATAWAARSLLADVYLTMAGWPLNQTSNYALAAAEADYVIKNGPFNLSTPYDKVFTTNNTPETVFALQFSVPKSLPQRSYGNSCVPLEEVAVNGNSGWDDYYPEINFYKKAPACFRTDATFYTTLKLRNNDGVTYTLVNWDDPRTRARHPYYKKFRAGLNGDGVSETATSIAYMNPSTNKALDIIRYPQVLLDYAEASTMATGNPSPDAYAAINQVRHRAGLGDLVSGLGGIAFRDSVVFERAYEFAGEFGMRWFDIVRLQLLPQVTADRANEPNQIPTSITSNPTILQQKYLAPIPFRDMNLEPGWTQNPGY